MSALNYYLVGKDLVYCYSQRRFVNIYTLPKGTSIVCPLEMNYFNVKEYYKDYKFILWENIIGVGNFTSSHKYSDEICDHLVIKYTENGKKRRKLPPFYSIEIDRGYDDNYYIYTILDEYDEDKTECMSYYDYCPDGDYINLYKERNTKTNLACGMCVGKVYNVYSKDNKILYNGVLVYFFGTFAFCLNLELNLVGVVIIDCWKGSNLRAAKIIL